MFAATPSTTTLLSFPHRWSRRRLSSLQPTDEARKEKQRRKAGARAPKLYTILHNYYGVGSGTAACSTEGERGAPSGGVVVAAETAAAKKKELLAARWRTSSSSPPRLQLESNSVDFKVRWRKERAAAWELFRHKSKFSTTCCYCHARRLIASVRYIFFTTACQREVNGILFSQN